MAKKKSKSVTKWIILGGAAVIVAAIAATITREHSIANSPDLLNIDLGGVKIELVLVQPGEFEMGSPDNEPGRDPSESPMHTVKIEQPFYIGKYEVTQAQWEAIIKSNQSAFRGDGTLPADSVGRGDAVKFCQYATQRTTRIFRLPSEAEWEYACRAGSNTAFSCGAELTSQYATFKASDADKPLRPTRVGSHSANAWGLYDMHGNVYEWVADVYRPDYKESPGDAPAAAPSKSASGDVEGGLSYVHRGGSWRNGAWECRSAVRFASSEATRSDTMGFRVVVELRK